MALSKSLDMSVHDMAERILVKLQHEIECDYLVTWSPLIAPWG